jgi:hypothetical protein
MGPQSAGETTGRPGRDLGESVPGATPAAWLLAAVGSVVAWEFVVSHVRGAQQRRFPWLVLERRDTRLEEVLFAVPRLAPEARWVDHGAYQRWEESIWQNTVEPIKEIYDVDELQARTIPRSPTRPRFADTGRLLMVARACDLEGLTTSQVVGRDGMSDAINVDNLARTVRGERRRGRELLHALGALPWAAFSVGTLPQDWWETAAFRNALAEWDSDAYRLWWRASREAGPAVALDREAADLLRRDARLRWCGIEDGVVTSADPVMRAAAKGRLIEAARAAKGTLDEWLASLIGFAGQTEECVAELVADADMAGELDELREAWMAARAETA